MISPRGRKRVARFLVVLTAVVWALAGSVTQASDSPSGAAILNDLRNLQNLGSVLYVAAHPDDENTQLIAYLARGRHYRTGYLSLTRGDGGQNLLGPEFGSELGLIRTHELLAARQVDGGVQFFTRALDFGYSKDYQQTLTKWNRTEVVADIVRVIRTFRPDVVITRFSPLPAPTHGHHTASAVLALEAFKKAGDANFPDELAPWQPRRIFWNVSGQGGIPAPGPHAEGTVHMDISGTDALTGQSFSELARLSRSMHKTQGFGGYTGGDDGPRIESFKLLDGEPATTDLMEGIDTTWARIPAGAGIGPLVDAAIAHFRPEDPVASLPALLDIHKRIGDLAPDPLVDEKRRLLDRIVAASIGLEVQTTVSNAEVVPGETVTLTETAVVHSKVPVDWMAVRRVGDPVDLTIKPMELQLNQSAVRHTPITLPLGNPISQPYWLRRDATAGMFQVDDLSLVGHPENPPVWSIESCFKIEGQILRISEEPVQIVNGASVETSRRRLEVVPPVSLGFASNVQLFTPGATRTIHVTVTPNRTPADGRVALEAPHGWQVAHSVQPFHLTGPQTFSFTVTAPSKVESVNLVASATLHGHRYSNERIDIRYDHIPHLLLQPPARIKAVCLDLTIHGHKVGYLPGAGDSTAQSLKQMGYQVVPLTGADLTAAGLRGLDAVVIGVRAFNVRTDLAANLPALWAYIQDGGTVVEQYNTPKGLQTPQLAPFSLTLSDNLPAHRVTDERSPVTLLKPDDAVFNSPNKITAADFDGWVQERGLNFPSAWDTEHFTALLACNDVGEAPLTSGLLVAHYGKGYFVYTGLSFFRQLPAGVEGAYRLFANLVSLGK